MNRGQEASIRSLSVIAGLIIGFIVGSLMSIVVRKIWLSEAIGPSVLPYYEWVFRIVVCSVFVDSYLTAASHLIKIIDLKRQHRMRFFSLREYNNIQDSFWLDFCWSYSWVHLELIGRFVSFWGVLFLTEKMLSPFLDGLSWIVAFIAACLASDSIKFLINTLFLPRRLLNEFQNASDILNIFSSRTEQPTALSEDDQNGYLNVQIPQPLIRRKKKSSERGGKN